jgi:hypothetical protein
MYGRDLALLDEPDLADGPRNAFIAKVVHALAANDRFRFVRTHDLFCTEAGCRPYDANGPLYEDNNHFGQRANAIVMARADAVLADLGGSTPSAFRASHDP